MKKILAILLSATLLCSAFCINASAAETSIEKERLNCLIQNWHIYNQLLGRSEVYSGNIEPEYTNAIELYNNPDSTDAECKHAGDVLLYDFLNFDVVSDFARKTYDIAVNEQNYNNWYTDEQWNDFQNKLSDLGKILDTVDSGIMFSKQITTKFEALLKTYNEMTNAYTVKGDLNKDGTVNVLDVTLLQKYLANSANLTGAQKMLAGATKYENPSITDVTTIQKYSVGQLDEMPNNNVFIADSGYTFMDTDLLMSKTINFTICPRTLPSIYMYAPLSNNYSGVNFLVPYYEWCSENGYEQ